MKSHLLACIAVSVICPSLLCAQSSGKKTPKPEEKTKAAEKVEPPAMKPASPTLATVDGQAITDDDLAPYVAGQLRPLREQEYQIKKKALDTLIGQKVLEAEAKKKGLTTEKLMEQEVDAKVPEPTDA